MAVITIHAGGIGIRRPCSLAVRCHQKVWGFYTLNFCSSVEWGVLWSWSVRRGQTRKLRRKSKRRPNTWTTWETSWKKCAAWQRRICPNLLLVTLKCLTEGCEKFQTGKYSFASAVSKTQQPGDVLTGSFYGASKGGWVWLPRSCQWEREGEPANLLKQYGKRCRWH